MPRSAAAASSKPSQSRTALRPNARAAATFRSVEQDEGIQNEDDDGAQDVADGDDDGTMEMFALLKEIQKRKTAKTSTRSTAFQTKKTTIYSESRKNADAMVQDGIVYIESCKSKIAEMKAQQLAQENHLNGLSLHWKSNDETIRALLGAYPSLIEDLSHRRAAHINDTSALLEAQSAERQAARRRLMKHATARMEENLENQKVATDANALIKHYTALLLS